MSNKTKTMANKVLAFVEANPTVLYMGDWVQGLDESTPLLPGDAMPEGVTMCVATIAAHLDGYTISWDEEECEYIAARGETGTALDLDDAGHDAFGITDQRAAILFNEDNAVALQVLSALAAGVEYSNAMVRQIQSAEVTAYLRGRH